MSGWKPKRLARRSIARMHAFEASFPKPKPLVSDEQKLKLALALATPRLDALAGFVQITRGGPPAGGRASLPIITSARRAGKTEAQRRAKR